MNLITMFKELKDTSEFTLQLNYQKFYELCNESEKNKLDMVKD